MQDSDRRPSDEELARVIAAVADMQCRHVRCTRENLNDRAELCPDTVGRAIKVLVNDGLLEPCAEDCGACYRLLNDAWPFQ